MLVGYDGVCCGIGSRLCEVFEKIVIGTCVHWG